MGQDYSRSNVIVGIISIYLLHVNYYFGDNLVLNCVLETETETFCMKKVMTSITLDEIR